MVDGSDCISAVNRSGLVSMSLEVLGEAEYISQETLSRRVMIKEVLYQEVSIEDDEPSQSFFQFFGE